MSDDIDVRAWLRGRGTDTVRHPGGTLYQHLCRVSERLAGLGHDQEVQDAGLTHAAYGTDGFDLALFFWQERDELRGLVGTEAEELVYLYGSCDRDRSWSRLAETGEVTDRFTGGVTKLDRERLKEFVDLSLVNELDVIEQSPAVLERNRRYFGELFTAWEPVADESLVKETRQLLSRL
ncbi:hypothetical protein ACTI_42450 [Actinoplanes sp. OR16]|uniref:DUF6817 domain-containing protein n=1 Tax=Actinoplanes sp. OR16 TaxID=946334 RepID=UPI000F6C617B|nr:hypothetical protein [Actinoplanes sp. OR16]BBH67560.1 hypothetical protein ACTI_42450 [Actinoplanes sp. OR16]